MISLLSKVSAKLTLMEYNSRIVAADCMKHMFTTHNTRMVSPYKFWHHFQTSKWFIKILLSVGIPFKLVSPVSFPLPWALGVCNHTELAIPLSWPSHWVDYPTKFTLILRCDPTNRSFESPLSWPSQWVGNPSTRFTSYCFN